MLVYLEASNELGASIISKLCGMVSSNNVIRKLCIITRSLIPDMLYQISQVITNRLEKEDIFCSSSRNISMIKEKQFGDEPATRGDNNQQIRKLEQQRGYPF